jgi:hypothetical protein
VRPAGVLGLAFLVSAVLGAQSASPPGRVVSGGRVVGFEVLAADAAAADVVVVSGPPALASPPLELALVQAIAGRREVILAIDAISRSAQDPLEHFQMGHLSDAEFQSSSRLTPEVANATLPVVRFAIERTWPIVAMGAPDDGSAGDAGTWASAVLQALHVASTGGRRPLVLLRQMVQTTRTPSWLQRLREDWRERRWVFVRLGNDSGGGNDYTIEFPD